MYDFDKDIEDILCSENNIADECRAWANKAGHMSDIIAAVLNASDAVKQLKQAEERIKDIRKKALDLINWIDEFQPRCDKPQGSYVHLLEEYKDLKIALTPPKQKD